MFAELTQCQSWDRVGNGQVVNGGSGSRLYAIGGLIADAAPELELTVVLPVIYRCRQVARCPGGELEETCAAGREGHPIRKGRETGWGVLALRGSPLQGPRSKLRSPARHRAR